MNNILLLRYTMLLDKFMEVPIFIAEPISFGSAMSLFSSRPIPSFAGGIDADSLVAPKSAYAAKITVVDEIAIEHLLSLTAGEAKKLDPITKMEFMSDSILTDVHADAIGVKHNAEFSQKAHLTDVPSMPFNVQDKFHSDGYGSIHIPRSSGISISDRINTSHAAMIFTTVQEWFAVGSNMQSDGSASVDSGQSNHMQSDTELNVDVNVYLNDATGEILIVDGHMKNTPTVILKDGQPLRHVLSGNILSGGNAEIYSKECLHYSMDGDSSSNGYAVLQTGDVLEWLDPIHTETVLLIRQSHRVSQDGTTITIY